MSQDPNQWLKEYIDANWKKTGNPKVEAYLKEQFWDKLDQMGDFAGHWIEQLESHFDALASPPPGFESLLSDFEEQDFDDLHFSLFGRQRRK